MTVVLFTRLGGQDKGIELSIEWTLLSTVINILLNLFDIKRLATLVTFLSASVQLQRQWRKMDTLKSIARWRDAPNEERRTGCGGKTKRDRGRKKRPKEPEGQRIRESRKRERSLCTHSIKRMEKELQALEMSTQGRPYIHRPQPTPLSSRGQWQCASVSAFKRQPFYSFFIITAQILRPLALH